MSENGQQVPILVRPHPHVTDRYQIAYGRRRLRAAAKLGLQVRAIVQTLTDDELVVAQGRENLDRADLSFIEKAFFARRLEDAGFDRATIIAALATDKSDLSRYIAVARNIPESLAAKIGPAGKAGRARWATLAEGLTRPKAMERVTAALASDAFRDADSDARFLQIFEAVAKSPARPAKKLETWGTPRGKTAARIEQDTRRTALIFDEREVPAFGQFVIEQLDELYNQFLEVSKGGGASQK